MNEDPPKPPLFTELQLRRALFDIENWMERFSVSKYIMLKDTAKALYDGVDLYGDCIYIGLEYRYVTRMVLSNFKTQFKNSDVAEYGFSYFFEDYRTKAKIPIHIQFIHNRYQFFKFLDKRFYMTGQYLIPNPFKNYWNERDGIL